MDTRDVLKKHISVCSTALFCWCYCYFISAKTQKGLFRFVCLLPVICFFVTLPLHLPRIYSYIFPMTWAAWISAAKLLLFAFGKGPLLSANQSFYSFFIHGTVPLRSPHSKLPSKPTTMNKFGVKIFFLAITTATILQYKQDLHPKMVLLCFAIFSYIHLDCVGAVARYFGLELMGLDLEPLFREPYLSTSVQQFWGRRWNLTISDLLRQGVYDPVRSAWAQSPAYFASFLLSGLAHEAACYCYTRVKPSWETTSFFVLHGIVVILERRVKILFNGRLELPPIVSMALTAGFVTLTALRLLFLPMINNGIFHMMFEEIRSVGEIIKVTMNFN